jgi:serine/threonine-protein kinase 24/25/MST4
MNPNGTIIRHADIGSGHDTLRPVKRVDAANSLRVSSEYTGSRRERSGSESATSPNSPESAGGSGGSSGKLVKPHPRRSPSDIQKAGRSLVDDVVVPTLQGVSHGCLYLSSRVC